MYKIYVYMHVPVCVCVRVCVCVYVQIDPWEDEDLDGICSDFQDLLIVDGSEGGFGGGGELPIFVFWNLR